MKTHDSYAVNHALAEILATSLGRGNRRLKTKYTIYTIYTVKIV